MTTQELQMLQALPLEIKIEKTKARIREWVYHWGKDSVYVSFSGGKDSTVLLDLVRQEFPDIEAVFVDTGLEYPEIREFVNTFDNVTILKPKMSFKEVVEKYGYPVISKEVSKIIYYAKKNSEWAIKQINGNYITTKGLKGFDKSKYLYLLNSPFKISSKCCDMLKKQPVEFYSKNKKFSFTGMMAEESNLRKNSYIKNGCNSFESKIPKSNPIGFWTEQDVLLYINKNNLQICSVYGNIIKDDDCKLKTTGAKRTGCYACMFGITQDRTPNRFQLMKKTHPKLYDFCIREENGLGLGKVLDFINVKY